MHLGKMANTVRIATVVFGATLLGTGTGTAGPITYDVNQTIGQYGSVVGTIQTDGSEGTLKSSSITAWNLTLNGYKVTLQINNNNSFVEVSGSDLTATATDLLFNFSATDNGYLLFQQVLKSGEHYYCNANSSLTCFEGANVVPERYTDSSFQNEARVEKQVIATAAISIPEPATMMLLGTGLFTVGIARRIRRSS